MSLGKLRNGPWWLTAVTVTVGVALSGCGGTSEVGSVGGTEAEVAGEPGTGPAATAAEVDPFCDEFRNALVLRDARLSRYMAELQSQPPTSNAGDQVMDGVLDTMDGVISVASQATIELLSSLTRPLPAELVAPTETALAIEQVYVDGALPEEGQIDELDESKATIVAYVNDTCGLDIDSSEF